MDRCNGVDVDAHSVKVLNLLVLCLSDCFVVNRVTLFYVCLFHSNSLKRSLIVRIRHGSIKCCCLKETIDFSFDVGRGCAHKITCFVNKIVEALIVCVDLVTVV